jgi:hypothetical protein
MVWGIFYIFANKMSDNEKRELMRKRLMDNRAYQTNYNNVI